jgi:hypothetical protein
MITNVTIPARYCVCDLCGYDWHSIAALPPTHCQNRACRSREWNGKKTKRVPAPKPQVVLPKPIKVRGGNEDEF